MSIKGQSLIEGAMIIPLFIIFWAALIWFVQVFVVSIQLMLTARHGVFWLAYQPASLSAAQEASYVHQECTSFLRQQNPSLLGNRIRITVRPGDRWDPLGPRHAADVLGLARVMIRLRKTLRSIVGLVRFQPAEVIVEYQWPVPPLLRAIPGFPSSFPLRGSCVAYR